MGKIMGGLDTGFDSRGNRWDLSEEDHQWIWRKFGDKGKLIKESDKTFEVREDCEADAKAHGMDGDFFKLM